MIRNKINFVSGETYTLSELFSGNRKIIIPDLQRDYCWGDTIHTDAKKELVSDFVNNLISQFYDSLNNNKDLLNLGLLYGYEAPENHIQLCDGQQRITTLFLLLGMINRKVGNNYFRKYLISDYEYFNDDKEPYLLYSIRESSLYFLSDLVCHFFIKETEDRYFVEKCENIEKSSWFFTEYHYDPSILSMIRAIKIIDNILREKSAQWCHNFGVFLTTKLSFMYYDMENRRNGEETFVVINTTGEPLSSTQNLKPLVLYESINAKNKDMSEKWEEIETWFWQKRKVVNGNDTADAGYNEFLRWVTMLNESDENEFKRILSEGTYVFPKDKIPFDVIYSYWGIVSFLYDTWEFRAILNTDYLSPKEVGTTANGIKIKVKSISQIDCFLFLPIIAYCKKWGTDSHSRNLYRLYQFFLNLTRIDNVGKGINELVKDAIYIARNCEDIISLINHQHNVSSIIATEEEFKKLSIYQSNIQERERIEEAFWRTQNTKDVHCHNIWAGQILPLIEWSSPNNIFSIEKYEKYVEIFDKTFEGECEDNIDLVRRALLTKGLQEYPKVFKGYTNLSFGWRWSDWNQLINDNKDIFKSFLDELLQGETLENMINGFDQTQKWAEFVKHSYLLAYSHQKNIQWDDKEGWLCIREQRATKYMSVMNLHLYHYLKDSLKKDGWSVDIYDQTDAHVIVVENKNQNLVFDIQYRKPSQEWVLNFFKRKVESAGVESALKPYLNLDDAWSFNGTRYEKELNFSDAGHYTYPNVLQELTTIIGKI